VEFKYDLICTSVWTGAIDSFKKLKELIIFNRQQILIYNYNSNTLNVWKI